LARAELTVFDDLGSRVEEKWRRAGWDEPDLATAAFLENPPRLTSSELAALRLRRMPLRGGLVVGSS
jgi:hypothetical protein